MLSHSQLKKQRIRINVVRSGVFQEIPQQRTFNVTVMLANSLQACLKAPGFISDASIHKIGAVSAVRVFVDSIKFFLQSLPTIHWAIIFHV